MNLVQLVERARSEFGVSGTTVTTVQDPLPSEIKRLRDWVITSWDEIQNLHEDWEFLRVTSSTIIPVNASILNPSEYAAEDIRRWREDSFRISDPGQGREFSSVLPFIPYDAWMATDGLAVNQYGKPRSFTVRPRDRALMVSPASDALYPLFYDYQRNPQALSEDDDTPILHHSHHMIVVYKAGMKYGRYEAAPEVSVDCRQDYHRMLAVLQSQFLPPITVGPNA